jgi:hypothetical protein
LTVYGGGMRPPSPGGEQVAEAQAERLDDVLGRAAREALQEDAAVVALADAEARATILVRRTARRPALAGTVDTFESLEELGGAHATRSSANRLSNCSASWRSASVSARRRRLSTSRLSTSRSSKVSRVARVTLSR